MANYRHILVAVDFSAESDNVIARALQLADQNRAKISLASIVEYVSARYAVEAPVPDDVDVEEQLLDQARRKLAELARSHGIRDAEQLVEMGVPKLAVVEIAERLGVDLIVIGSHGRHGLQLLLGSTANGVLHQSKCDVLAVRVRND